MRKLARRDLVLAAAAFVAPAAAADAISWRALAEGLDHATIPIAGRIGDGRLHVLRIDPRRFRFRLITGAATGAQPRTARQWAREHGLAAATNAGMFHPGGLPVGFARADERTIQSRVNRDRSVFTFDQAGARLLDLDCDTFEPEAATNALQSIRMLSCGGRNVWRQSERIWSIVSLAQDGEGRLLFLHLRSPLSVHDFVNALRRLPLSITRAMYLEGGPEATLYAAGAGVEIERFGSYETGFNENDGNAAAWPLPNVLGVAAR